MIGVFDTSLQLQSITTAHTFNSFCMHYYSFITSTLARIQVMMSNSYLSSVILFVVMGTPLLIFVAAKTGASDPLPSKVTSASAAIPAFRQCLPNRCLANGHIPSQYH
jgi:hypothetical protein